MTSLCNFISKGNTIMKTVHQSRLVIHCACGIWSPLIFCRVAVNIFFSHLCCSNSHGRHNSIGRQDSESLLNIVRWGVMSDKIFFHFRYLVTSYYIMMNGLINKKKQNFYYLTLKSFLYQRHFSFCLQLLGTNLGSHPADILSHHLHPLIRPSYTLTLLTQECYWANANGDYTLKTKQKNKFYLIKVFFPFL